MHGGDPVQYTDSTGIRCPYGISRNVVKADVSLQQAGGFILTPQAILRLSHGYYTTMNNPQQMHFNSAKHHNTFVTQTICNTYNCTFIK